MPCYLPIAAQLYIDGKAKGKCRVLKRGHPDQNAELPCGKCVGCRLEKAKEWALRCYHEASLYGVNNSFITLTYAPEHLPKNGTLVPEHFTLFMKRLRRKYKSKIRFYMCGEYGEKNHRPHYHALLFNLQFTDRTLCNIRNNNRVYKSASLLELWPYGQNEIGSVTFQSAGYVARYILKKQFDEYGFREYAIPDANGEISSASDQLVAPYTRMSLRPGIGKEWYEKTSRTCSHTITPSCRTAKKRRFLVTTDGSWKGRTLHSQKLFVNLELKKQKRIPITHPSD